MFLSVELDDQARDRAVQVGATDEPAAGIVEVLLDFGSGQPGLEEKPAESGLHRRLSRFRKLIKPAEAEAQCLVGKDQALDCGKSPPQITKRAFDGGGRQASHGDDVNLR